MFLIAWIVGFVMCVLAIILAPIFEKKDGPKIVSVMLFVLGFVTFMGSAFLNWSGTQEDFSKDNQTGSTQQVDKNDMDDFTGEPEEPVSLDAIESSIQDAIPEEHKSSKWFYINCDSNLDGSIFVDLQIDQGTDDTDAALASASKYFEIAKNEIERAGASFESFSLTVVNGGSPVGLFSTSDGQNYTFISDGKMTEITLP